VAFTERVVYTASVSDGLFQYTGFYDYPQIGPKAA